MKVPRCKITVECSRPLTRVSIQPHIQAYNKPLYKPISLKSLAANMFKRTVRVGQTTSGLVVSKSDDKQVLLLTLESLSKLFLLYDQHVFNFIFTVASVDLLLIKSRIPPRPGWNRYVYSPLTFSCAINGFMKGIHKYYFITFLILVLPGAFHY